MSGSRLELDPSDAFLRELEALEDARAPELGLAAVLEGLRPEPLSQSVRAQLLAAATKPSRFERFERVVAEFLDVSLDKARALLARIDDPSAWSHELPGISFLWIEGGPKVANALRGFVRVDAGLAFPHHSHYGDEHSLVLQGGFEDRGRGLVFHAGDIDHLAAGTSHDFQALSGGTDLLALSIIHGGLCALGRDYLPR